MFKEELTFKVKKSTYKVKSDGSISVFLKCPVRECLEGFTTTYKSYPTYYKYKKNPQNIEERTTSKAPKWQLTTLTKHLLECHGASNGTSVQEEDSSLSNADDSNSNISSAMELCHESSEENNRGDVFETDESLVGNNSMEIPLPPERLHEEINNSQGKVIKLDEHKT